MKRAEGHWLASAGIGALIALALFVARDKDRAETGAWFAVAFGAAFGFGLRNARQIDKEASGFDARVERFQGKRGA